MIDPKLIRQNPDVVKEKLKQRGEDLTLLESYIQADQKWRLVLTEIDQLKMKRNQQTPKGKPSTEQLQQLKQLSEAIKSKQQEVSDLEAKTQQLGLQLPNIPDDTVPVGRSEEQNECVKTVGTPRSFDFEVNSHDACLASQSRLNFSQAATITGSRFVVMQKQYATLERALINFMLDTHTHEHGYEEVLPPVIVNSNALKGTGQLPKFKDDLFKLEDTDYWLSPTAEVQCTNLFQGHILAEEELPKKVTAATACFRKEAGSYGKDIKGIIRQHQFNKVELVQLVKPEESFEALNQLLSHAEKIVQQLELPYRIVKLCTGDLGFASALTYDIEVWFPSQQCYREISSCSNFLDFQSRRAMIRYKSEDNGNVSYLHTINGSGIAVGRAMAAIIENHQEKDGSITMPKALKKYLRFETI